MDRKTVYVLIGITLAGLSYWKRGAIMTAAKGLSDSALSLISGFEGFSANPYVDAKGQSVGFGHFILPSDNLTFPLSENDAYDLLSQDVSKATAEVEADVVVPLTQNQKDALISLAYNIGTTAFRNSTLLKKLNAGDYAGAANEFPRWNKSGGKVLDALVTRRDSEMNLFLA